MVRLGSIITQVRGVSYSPKDLHDSLNDESVILLRANNIQDGKINLDDVVFVDKKKVSTNQYLRRGDILICASSGSKDLVGKAAYFEENIVATFGAFCKVARPAILCTEFIGHFFNSPFYRKRISALSSGANINNIRNEHIDNLEIALPAEDVQKLITDKLNILSKIISLREQQLSKLDQLVKARFVEMFGDMQTTQFTIVTLESICEFIKDGTHQTPIYTDDVHNGFKFLSSKDITSGKINWNNIKYIPKKLHDELYARIRPQRGDILLAKNGTTGVAAVVENEDIFDIYVSLAILRPKKENNVIYLWCAINSYETKRQFDKSLKGIGVPNLHLGDIRKSKIILPPLALQEEFAAFVQQVEKSKSTVKQSLEKLEILKKSLMQEYFG